MRRSTEQVTQELSLAKPLPPQRWGFLPTNQFWALAALTPIAFIYYLGMAMYFPLLDFLGLVWWQVALAIWMFHEVWGGVVERCARRHLARRQIQPLQRSGADSGDGGASRSSAYFSTGAVTAPVPVDAPRAPAFTAEDWDVFYARVYGRFSGVVQVVADLGFVLLLFYPGWLSKALALVWLVASTMVARSCKKRWESTARAAPRLRSP